VTLYQYGDKVTKQFFHYMAQYIKSIIGTGDLVVKKGDNPIVEKYRETFNFTKLYEGLADLCAVDPEVTDSLLRIDLLTKFH
jgi:hypothetical protein